MSRIARAFALFWICATPQITFSQNVLVLLADDIGLDRIEAYGVSGGPGQTPHIDRLARNGVRFQNAWSNPNCSATRALMLTGRYSFRTGIGKVLKYADPGLPTTEWTLPELLKTAAQPYHTALFGKWHLGWQAAGLASPQAHGFDQHAGGALDNLPSYFAWDKNTNGAIARTAKYATTDTVDDAIRAARTLPEPWFLWVAFNAAHKPFHKPPASLHDVPLSGIPALAPLDHQEGMVEALDTEIGRLLEHFDPGVLTRTTIVFAGDNGTPEVAAGPQTPAGQAKGSVFQGGIHVPLIVAGPRVVEPGRTCDALVSLADVFGTVLDLAEVDPADTLPSDHALDSVSLLPYLLDPAAPPQRRFVYAEKFPTNFQPDFQPHRALRDERYKLIVRVLGAGSGQVLFYDLKRDPYESTNLMAGSMTAPQQAAYVRLQRNLSALVNP